MKFLTEITQSVQVLCEDVDGTDKKRMYISGPFLMMNKPNRNGRIYPEKVMTEAVKNYKRDYIDTKRALGELNHPKDRLNVDPERACIMLEALERDGDYYYGKAKVLSTPLGQLLENLLNDGVKIGVSSRGAGNVSNQGKHKIVQPGYMLTVGSDVVHDPSVAEAFVDHLMEEKEYLLVNGVLVEEDIVTEQNRIKRATSAKLEEAKLQAFQTIINKLSGK